ncbi:unnamed protein product [Moneuplotes crassus]|uniref:Uncharacterized protein n=1 Tax=Euplotes crassus TaxID=5936 RepID=A0AAD1XPK7_EUPCR|nr:unnamed protein product [Moneuplotes crassus]
MEVNKCEIGTCDNNSEYLHRGLKIRICKQHFQPSEKDKCVRLGQLIEIEDALRVVKTCINNFCTGVELGDNIASIKKCKHFVEQVNHKVAQVSKEIESAKSSDDLQSHDCLENEFKDITSELYHCEFFTHFCVKNYMTLMCDYLKIDNNKISRLISTDDEIRNFKGKLEEKEQELKKLEDKYRQICERFINHIGLDTKASLAKAYKIITNLELFLENDEKLILDCNTEEDTEFMKAVGDNILPNCSELTIDSITSDVKLGTNFICSSFPQTVQRFHLNLNGKMLDCKEAIDMIHHASPHVSIEFCIYGMRISQFQMKNILQSICRNQRIFGFGYCKFELDSVPSFQYCLNGSIIESLDICHCGRPEYNDWKKHPERFTNLIEGLSQSKDFMKNLKRTQLLNCGLEKQHVRYVLDKFDFKHVEITEHSI